jgi:DNA-directed RNA polymerase specialized sigma24 family protein
MPPENAEVAALVKRARAGDQEAARRLVEAWGPPLQRLARRKLRQDLRSLYDPEDFVQDALDILFRRLILEHPSATPEELLALLDAVVRNKVAEANRHFQYEKCDLRRARSLHGLGAEENEALVGRQPTAEQVSMASEQWAGLLQGQPIAHQLILVLLRDGYTRLEIAEILTLNEKTVRRVVERAVQRLAGPPGT